MTSTHPRSIVGIVALLAIPAALLLPASHAAGQATDPPPLAKVQPATFGEPFPAHTFTNLNPGAGGPEAIDLGQVLGKKPIILCYWIAGNKRAEEMLLGVQDLVAEAGGDGVALYAVATQRPGLEAAAIRERARSIGVRVPVLDDVGFRIGQQLAVQTVPSISLIDGDGNLRMSNGSSLLQDLEYKMNLEAAIRRLVQTGKVGTYGYLPRYYPANEMVGKPSPDFEAPDVKDGVVQRWHSLLDKKKVNILIFWSVDCPHCRKQLPEIDRWLRANPDGVKIVTAAGVTDETSKSKTREYTSLSGFSFTTLMDVERKIGTEYNVTSTPTIFIVGPDGVIDSVLLSGTANFGEIFEARMKLLLPAGT
jgi:peroxiredoxin